MPYDMCHAACTACAVQCARVPRVLLQRAPSAATACPECCYSCSCSTAIYNRASVCVRTWIMIGASFLRAASRHALIDEDEMQLTAGIAKPSACCWWQHALGWQNNVD